VFVENGLPLPRNNYSVLDIRSAISHAINMRTNDVGFRRLIVWQEAKRLCVSIYQITASLPKSEQFNMTSQLRRATSSVMANIAEGSAMPTKAHRIFFYVRARGSVVEVDTFINLACALGMVSDEIARPYIDHCARLSFLLTRLVQS
jgi:four helix bundle protein